MTEIPYKLYGIFSAKKIPIFHRKIATSLWKMVRLTQKFGMHDPSRHLQKIDTGNFDISIFADFTAAEIGKNDVFWRLSSRTAQ